MLFFSRLTARVHLPTGLAKPRFCRKAPWLETSPCPPDTVGRSGAMSSSSASRVRVERNLSPSGRAGDQADRQSVTSKPMTLRVNSRRSSASLPRRRRGRAKPTNVSITSGAALPQPILEPETESANRAAYPRGGSPVCVYAWLGCLYQSSSFHFNSAVPPL